MIRLNTRADIKVDNRQWEKMKKNLLRNTEDVRVGWMDNIHPSSGEYVAQIAAWNEEGHVNGGYFAGTITPARPFIRTGFIPSVKKNISMYFPDIHNIAMGRSTWRRLNKKMGEDYVKLMQNTILKWDSPPNSPVTVSIKGFNNPLIDSGYMMKSVKYKIVPKGFK